MIACPRMIMINNRGVKKEVRIESILTNSISPISKRQLHHILPDISIRTIGSVISRLLSECKIEKVGTFRDTRYRASL